MIACLPELFLKSKFPMCKPKIGKGIDSPMILYIILHFTWMAQLLLTLIMGGSSLMVAEL